MKTGGLIWAGLFVADLDASIAFYQDAIGLTLRQRGEGWAHFDVGNGAMLELFGGGVSAARPKGPDQQSAVFALRVDNLESVMDDLSSKGITFDGEIGEFRGTRWVYFNDPEGNRIELKQI